MVVGTKPMVRLRTRLAMRTGKISRAKHIAGDDTYASGDGTDTSVGLDLRPSGRHASGESQGMAGRAAVIVSSPPGTPTARQAPSASTSAARSTPTAASATARPTWGKPLHDDRTSLAKRSA